MEQRNDPPKKPLVSIVSALSVVSPRLAAAVGGAWAVSSGLRAGDVRPEVGLPPRPERARVPLAEPPKRQSAPPDSTRDRPSKKPRPRTKGNSAVALLKETANDWMEDNASRLAAALAYYTLLSLAPMLVVAVSVAGLVFGEDAARGQIATQLQGLVGPEAGQAIQSMLANAKTPSSGVIGTVVGSVVLLFGASGVFGELQSSLNTIWEVAPKPGRGVMGFLRDRFFSFTMVLGVAFLLLVSLVVSAALGAVGKFFAAALPGGEAMWHVVNFAVSLGVISLLFGLIFKVVPDVKISWRDVRAGALATGLLFTIGKLLIGLYLGKASVGSPYGAAGSLVVMVVWVYYSAQILFLGAEFTQAYARRYGSRIEPSENAIPVTKEARAQLGLVSDEDKERIAAELVHAH